MSLLTALSAFAISKLDLFSLDSASDAVSDAVIQRIMAPAYGHSGRGQALVSVITIDDTNVANLHKDMEVQDWPPSYTDYANIIARIRDAAGDGEANRPRAIFLDFTFFGDLRDLSQESQSACSAVLAEGAPYRSEQAAECGHWALLQEIEISTQADKWRHLPACHASDFAKLACIVKTGGTPVMVGRPAKDMSPMTTELQAKLAERTVVADVTFDKGAYPMPTLEGDLRSPQLSDLSPAAALYAAYCLAPASACEPFNAVAGASPLDLETGATPATWPQDFSRPLSIVWGARPAPGQSHLNTRYNNRFTCTVPEIGLPILGYVDRIVRSVLNIDPSQPDCYYSRSYPYHALNLLTPEQAKDLLKDRLVIIGPNFTRGSDLHDSPLKGAVPGAFIHAMALDNLIEYGKHYRKVAVPVLDGGKILETGLLFCLLVLGHWGALRRHHLDEASPEGEAPLAAALRLYGVLLGISLLLIITVVAIGIWGLREEPINWLGVGATALTLGLLQRQQPVGEDMLRLLDRGPFGSHLASDLRRLRAWFDIESGVRAARAEAACPSPPIPTTPPIPPSPQAKEPTQ
ncbi:CHASE2 domain-containing protein [Asticcacaulis sp. 201]|uniref:CHASE2 domain-containing protein n=1 Tax=Asticcacaulis sp. 201 TaxID=3028787 RepID=UPI002916A53C|nr:CHASE2 domain-containing protein [Asticcacaulis sp. 201]MDV6329982.1 CHASE2 domain-containing protein [Asticcacaulis sp. 201]